MDTDKILLEIYGKVESTSTDVKHVITQQSKLEDKVVALHKRVDGQDGQILDCQKQIYKGMSIIGGITFVMGICGHWLKVKIFGG